MKVALLTDGITPYVIGGMQKHSFLLAKYLVAAGVDLLLVHCVPPGAKIPEENEVKEKLLAKETGYSAVRVIGMNFPVPGRLPGHYIRESYAYSSEIADRVKHEIARYDFIYAQGFCGWKLMEEKKKGFKCGPVAVNFHGLEMFQRAANTRSWLEQYLFRQPVKKNLNMADAVFSLGGKLTGIIQQCKVPAASIYVTPIGIEESWVKEEKTRDKVKPVNLVFIGRYERRKGIEELSQVLQEMRGRNDFKFHFIGPVPENKRISSDNISYYGELNDPKKIQDILSRCDVLVCPSWSEGMPTVILEAMASGLAVIATNVGAVAEEVDSSNGWLIEAGNIPALKKAITTAIEMKTVKLEELKKQSIEKVKAGFLWKNNIRDLIEKIKLIIGN